MDQSTQTAGPAAAGPAPAARGEPLLEIRGLTKQFPGVMALNNVDLTVNKSEIHVLLGENGAGKSTLIKCILGIYQPNNGTFTWEGKPIQIHDIQEAYDLGISAIFQELSNVPCLSVTENMFLGNMIKKGPKSPFVDWKFQYAEARKYLDMVGCHVDVRAPIEKLGMGQKQLIEVARALQRNSRLIIMDEPTSSLSRSEIDQMLELMHNLRAQGISIVFITHKLDEAREVGDVVTVLKDGKLTGETMHIDDADEDRVITMMVGRTLEEKYPKRVPKLGEEMIRVERLSGAKFQDVSFSVRRGEMLGIFGLVGAGRTETVRALFGADPMSFGRVSMEGKEVVIRHERDAINAGIVLATENRKEEGLVLEHDVVENCTLPVLQDYRMPGGLLRLKTRYDDVHGATSRVNLRPMILKRATIDFSGGNQQKIIIAKWLMTKAKVYIFDEPTKGIDVGSKTEIYGLMNALLGEGAAIIMVSSEMLEVMGLSDNILTMYEGRVTGYVANDEKLTQEKLMILATGGKINE